MNLDASLGVHPLETSDDDLGRRSEDDFGPDNHALKANFSPGLGGRIGGGVTATTKRPGVAPSSIATTSTPKGHYPPASGVGLKSSTSFPPLPQPDFSSPSRPPLSSPSTGAVNRDAAKTATKVTTPTMNRSFPRPTQSVSPEFPPLSPRPSSPEDYSSGVDESKL